MRKGLSSSQRSKEVSGRAFVGVQMWVIRVGRLLLEWVVRGRYHDEAGKSGWLELREVMDR